MENVTLLSTNRVTSEFILTIVSVSNTKCYCGSNFSLVWKLLNKLNASFSFLLDHHKGSKAKANKNYCPIFTVKISRPPCQCPVYLGTVHYTGFSWCCGNCCWLVIVLWCGYCSVSFHAFVLRHLVIAPVPNTKTLPIIKCGTSHKRPPKMQFSSCLRQIVTHGNQTTRGLFRERSRHISFLEENLLHLISKLWYVWFQFVNESSLYTFSGIVHSMNKEQVRGQTMC